MGRRKSDNQTPSLFDWEPPEIIRRFDEQRVRSVSIKSTIARAIAAALKDSDKPRKDIAASMSGFLGERVTKNMLDAYASESRDDHNISYVRLLALAVATSDERLLQIGADLIGHLVVDNKYVDWIELGMEAEKREQAHQYAAERDKNFDYHLRRVRRGQ